MANQIRDLPKRYRVLNPRGFTAGVASISFSPIGNTDPAKVVRWYEGEEFTPPDGFDSDGALLAGGYIEEVR